MMIVGRGSEWGVVVMGKSCLKESIRFNVLAGGKEPARVEVFSHFQEGRMARARVFGAEPGWVFGRLSDVHCTQQVAGRVLTAA